MVRQCSCRKNTENVDSNEKTFKETETIIETPHENRKIGFSSSNSFMNFVKFETNSTNPIKLPKIKTREMKKSDVKAEITIELPPIR